MLRRSGARQSFQGRFSRCSYVPLTDGEDNIFANTRIKDGTEQSELMQLFLRQDIFFHEKYPATSEAVRYFKQTEGGRSIVCKALEDYAAQRASESLAQGLAQGRAQGLAQGREEERIRSIRILLGLGLPREKILSEYSEEDPAKAEADGW